MSDYSDCDEPGAHGGLSSLARIQLSGGSSHEQRVSSSVGSGAQPGESPLRDVSNRSSINDNSSKQSAHSKQARSAIDLCSPAQPQQPWEEQENLHGDCAAATPSPNAAVPAASSSAASSSSSPSADAAAASAAATAVKKLAHSSFNQLVREAKAAEERGDLARALELYRDHIAPMRPELDTVAKKVRILSKKIKKQLRQSREQQEDEEEEEPADRAEQAEQAVPAAQAAAASSSSAVAEPRQLPLVLDGKFAFDAANSCYTVVRPAQSAAQGFEEEVNASSMQAADGSSSALMSTSPLLSSYSLSASMFDRIYPYQQEGIHWLYNHIHCPAASVAADGGSSAASSSSSSGGILGDDMGLGKTVSTSVFLAGLFAGRHIRRALVIVPISVMEHWRAEIIRWCDAKDDEDQIAAAKGKGGLKIAEAGKRAAAAAGGLRLLSVYVGKRTPKQRAASELALTQLLSSATATGIVLTTYGQFGAKPELFSTFPHAAAKGGARWDYIIADEAHKLKNPETQLHQKLHAVPTAHRLLLTGTPIMNDLDELWALMDLASGGSVLGSRKQFKTDFAARIMAGLAKCATAAEKDIGAQLTRTLKERMGPYMLRREKAQVKNQMSDNKEEEDVKKPEAAQGNNSDGQDADAEANPTSIPRSLSSSSAAHQLVLPRLSTQKNDLIIWLHLSELQESLYRKFLVNDSVRSVFTTKSRGPLPALTALKKLCDHPRMIDPSMAYMETIADDLRAMESLPGVHVPVAKPAAAAAVAPGGVAASSSSSSSRTKEIPQATAAALAEPGRPQLAEAVRMLCVESAKYACLERLLRMHLASGHRTLIFSQSLRMLGFITLLLAHLQMKYLRIDGTVSDPAERQRRVDQFNRDPSFHAFLLTTRSGAVGLNLTGASRVVIFDPDWAPSLDNQAVDRAYRIGQTRNVVVYRMITCGGVEEVIYRKQVFKGSIIRAATGVKQQASADAAAAAPVRSGSDPSASSSAVADEAPTRYFGKDELREVFLFKSSLTSSAFDSLRRLHPPAQRKSYPELDAHIRDIEAIPGVHGITDHDLMFSETAVKPEVLAAEEAAAAAQAAANAAAASHAAAADSADVDALSASMIDDLAAVAALDAAQSVPPSLERQEDIAAIVAAATSRLEATIGAPRTPPRAKRTKKQRERHDGDHNGHEQEESKEAAEEDANSESTSSTPSQTDTLSECDDRSNDDVRGSPLESPPGGLRMHDADAQEEDRSVENGSPAVVAMAPMLDESIIDLTGADEGVQMQAPDRMLGKVEVEAAQDERAEMDDLPAIDADALPVPTVIEAAEAEAVDPDATLPYNKPDAESESAVDLAPTPATVSAPLPLADGEEKESERADAADEDFIMVSPPPSDDSASASASASAASDSTLPYEEMPEAAPLTVPLSPSSAVATASPSVSVAESAPSDCSLPFLPPSPGFLAAAVGGGGTDRPSIVFDLSLSSPSSRSSFAVASPGGAAALMAPALDSVPPVVPVLPAMDPACPPVAQPSAPAPALADPVRALSRGHVILQLDDSSDDEDDDDDEAESHAFEDAREWKDGEEQPGVSDTSPVAAAAALETPAAAASYSDLMQRASEFDPSSSEGRLLRLECLLHAFAIDKSDPQLQLQIFQLATETGLSSLLPVD